MIPVLVVIVHILAFAGRDVLYCHEDGLKSLLIDDEIDRLAGDPIHGLLIDHKLERVD